MPKKTGTKIMAGTRYVMKNRYNINMLISLKYKAYKHIKDNK